MITNNVLGHTGQDKQTDFTAACNSNSLKYVRTLCRLYNFMDNIPTISPLSAPPKIIGKIDLQSFVVSGRGLHQLAALGHYLL